MGNGLQGILTPIRANIEGFSPMAIGVLGSSYFAGSVIGCLICPHIVKRVGHIRSFVVLAAIVVLFASVGCETGPKSAKGFSLPDGDAERGKAVFAQLKCTACHRVLGARVLGARVNEPEQGEGVELEVVLGGEVTRVKTYGELVTSIINPSHRLAKGYSSELIQVDGQSRMKNYNDVLTVSQLIDLVAFLQSHYKLKVYEPTDYPMYY